MRIKKINSQSRRDFSATYICEHCGNEYDGYGYDDRNFHDNVIPEMVCTKCDKKADSNYIGLTTKYQEGEQV